MPDPNPIAARFAAMAELVSMNAGTGFFGGAFVIVPPGEQETFEVLILDSRQDPAQFWSVVKTKAEIALNELIANERSAQAFRGPR
jgi:hypothetical protein